MHLNIPTINLNGEEAKALMEKEGTGKLIKDTDRSGHIWLEGYNGPRAMGHFAVDRGIGWSNYDDTYGTRGWVGTTARGWRTPDEDFARVELLYVGEDAMTEAYLKRWRFSHLDQGVLRVWPWGVPKPRPRTGEPREPSTVSVAYLETLKTVEERFKALNKRRDYWDEECEEFQSWSVKGWVSHDHTVALMPKAVLPAFNDAMAKTGASYETLTLADLTRIPDPHSAKGELYTRTGGKVGFCCEFVDGGLRAWYPRFLKAKYAPTIKVHYPSKQAPAVFYTEDQDCLLIVAPYVIE